MFLHSYPLAFRIIGCDLVFVGIGLFDEIFFEKSVDGLGRLLLDLERDGDLDLTFDYVE